MKLRSITLSQREKVFVESYASSAKGNGSAAVREAGFETRHADVYAAKLLSKARIREAIEARLKQLRREADVTAQEVIATLAAQMRGDITEMMDANGQFDLRIVRRKKLGGLIRAIEFANLKETRKVKGRRVSTTRQVVRRIELVSQQHAAIQLCKVLGIEHRSKNLSNPQALPKLLEARIEFAIEGFRRGGATLTRRDVLEMYTQAPESSGELMPLIQKELAELDSDIQTESSTKGEALSLREEAFVEAYVVSARGNGAAAVRDAGFTAKNADVYAGRLLARDRIREAIERRQEQLRRESKVSTQEVIATLAGQMRGDITECVDANGQFDVSVVRRKKLGGLIKTIEFTSVEETRIVKGELVSTTKQVVRRIELVSQQQAAIHLCKLLGVERKAGNQDTPETLRKLLEERIAFAIEGFRRGGIEVTRREVLEFYAQAPQSSGTLMPLIREELDREELDREELDMERSR